LDTIKLVQIDVDHIGAVFEVEVRIMAMEAAALREVAAA
jgi:hypothetical protein